MGVLKSLARAVAVWTRRNEGTVLRTYLQRLCASVRKARARAMLRRAGGEEGLVPVPAVLRAE